MRARFFAYLRGEHPADDDALEAEFVELAIKKLAERRGLRPDQVRLSLLKKSLPEIARTGAGTPMQDDTQGMH